MQMHDISTSSSGCNSSSRTADLAPLVTPMPEAQPAGDIAAAAASISMLQLSDSAASTTAVSLSSAISSAQEAFSKQQYRTAAAICSNILQQHPEHPQTSLLLSRILLAAGQPEEAEEVLVTGLNTAANSSVEWLQQLGMCQFAAGRYDEAVETLQTAAASPKLEAHQELKLQALTATVLYSRGGVFSEVADHLMFDVLQRDPQQVDALKLFARRAADQENWETASQVVLQLLTRHQEDKEVQQLLVQTARQPAGLQHIIQLIGESSQSSTALVFVAKTLQKHGVRTAALQLYSKAVQLQPRCATAALGLVQVLESNWEHMKALEVVLSFCGANREVAVGSVMLQDVECLLTSLSLVSKPGYSANRCLPASLPWLLTDIHYAGRVKRAMSLCEATVTASAISTATAEGGATAACTVTPTPTATANPTAMSAANGEATATVVTVTPNLTATANGLTPCISRAVVQVEVPHDSTAPTPCRCSHNQHHNSSRGSSVSDTDKLKSSHCAERNTNVNNGRSSSSSVDSGSFDTINCQICNNSQQLNWTRAQLDMLGLLFTTVKILFCCGALDSALKLSQFCDVHSANTAAAAAAGPLHLTHIRNAAAYVEYIRHILLDGPPDLPAFHAAAAAAAALQAVDTDSLQCASTAAVDAASCQEQHKRVLAAAEEHTAAGAAVAADLHSCVQLAITGAAAQTTNDVKLAKPLYLCGDSHCLSGAWRFLEVSDEQRLICPLLVTGLKVWHLSSSSSAISDQFWQAIRSLPAGSDLVLVMGEIDCREGMVTAVERMKHPSLQEAISATVNVYTTVLHQLVTQHNLNIYVHPIPPLIDESRKLVLQFESALQLAVQQLRQTLTADVRDRVRYLNFGQQLLQCEGGSLRCELQLDGSHLRPRYLKYLEAAISLPS